MWRTEPNTLLLNIFLRLPLLYSRGWLEERANRAVKFSEELCQCIQGMTEGLQFFD